MTGLPSIERRVLLGGHARARRLDCYRTGLARPAVVRAADALALAPTVCPHPRWYDLCCEGRKAPVHDDGHCRRSRGAVPCRGRGLACAALAEAAARLAS